jgi:pectate lyase
MATLACVSASVTQAADTIRLDEQPIGWASVEAGATGGKGGQTFRVSDAKSLTKAACGDEPAIIVITGPIALEEKVRVGSNKTILGGEKAELTGGSLHLTKVHNVIIRNLSIHDSPDDAINVEGGSHHVWIDHCDLSKCYDGLVDIKHGSDLATVSWCRFHDHHKTCLLGHSDKPSALDEDRGKLRVTYHHNFFDGSQTRHPRVRMAETVHVFNNYYRDNAYGVASTNNAGVLVEGNYFERCKSPTLLAYGNSKDPGRLVERKNAFVDSGMPIAAGDVAEVPYAYTLDKASDVPSIVRSRAGIGTLSPF